MQIWYNAYGKNSVEGAGWTVERLDKLLSRAGYGRREAAGLIRQGRVTVEGRTVTAPESKWEDAAAVAVDGEAVAGGYCYLMLHKPAGVVSATRDDRETTVLELLPEALRRRAPFPVGRLDKDTTGLLILTDDGPLAHTLTSPRHHVDKVYEVRVDGVLTAADQEALAAGLELGDGLRCQSARLELTDRPDVGYLTLREGKFHQVKRMMACLGKPVTALKRVSMGGVTLDPRLEPGQWRELTREEQERLCGQRD